MLHNVCSVAHYVMLCGNLIELQLYQCETKYVFSEETVLTASFDLQLSMKFFRVIVSLLFMNKNRNNQFLQISLSKIHYHLSK